VEAVEGFNHLPPVGWECLPDIPIATLPYVFGPFLTVQKYTILY
jgi:hypothetical protein